MSKSVKLNPTVYLRRLRELKCKHCGQIFYTVLQLERHQHSHSQDGNHSHQEGAFQCDLCGKYFASLFNCNRHRKLHDKEKTSLGETSSDTTPELPSRPQCLHEDGEMGPPACPMGVACVPSHDEHQPRHTGKPPFSCSMCSSTFKTYSALKCHGVLHHNKHNISDQPSSQSGTALGEPNIEPSEAVRSPDTRRDCTLDNGPRPIPAMFASFRLTSAFLEVKYHKKFLQESSQR